MAPKRKATSSDERDIIIKLWNEGKSLREIGKTVGRTHSTVQGVIKNYKSTGSTTSKPRSGRPSTLTDREKRHIINEVQKNPKLTASKIAKDVEERFQKTICSDTVCKILKKSGYHARVARKKPFVSLINRQKRIAFAKEHISKPLDFWEKVLFSDESKFCIFGITGRKLVWRKQGTALDRQNLAPTVKHGGGGVMVWGCMAYNGVGNIEFIESTMDKYRYLDILKSNLRQSATKIGLENGFVFQQDNDPKHTAEIVKLWLLYNVPKQLHTPPQSPDLNPIEHLWDLLERKIRQHNITSKTMLKDVITEEWGKITSEETSKLVKSMPKRLAEVIRRRGYPTSY